jgi:hypothetical protein
VLKVLLQLQPSAPACLDLLASAGQQQQQQQHGLLHLGLLLELGS